MLSDDLPALPSDRLRIAWQLLPLIAKRPQVVDWFDAPTPSLLRLDLENCTGKWVLLAVFNWADHPQERSVSLSQCGLTRGNYFAREFWSGEGVRISGDTLTVVSTPAHGVRLYALRAIPGASIEKSGLSSQPIYLGGDLHISQGLEVTNWHAKSGGLQLELTRPGESRGVIDLALPQPPQKANLDGANIEWYLPATDIYRFSVAFRERALLEVV
jgi:hypothetical protein